MNEYGKVQNYAGKWKVRPNAKYNPAFWTVMEAMTKI